MNYWVYAIYNYIVKRLYIGQTQDLKKRICLHNSKEFTNSYTSRFNGSWDLIYSEQCPDRESALKRERQLKSYRGREFVKTFIRKVNDPR